MAEVIYEKNIANDATQIGWDLAKYVYRVQLDALTSTLDHFEVPHSFYSILREREDSVCLICDEDGWKVFTSERGMKMELQLYSSVEEACDRLIYTMSEDREEENEMKQYFHNLLNIDKRYFLNPFK